MSVKLFFSFPKYKNIPPETREPIKIVTKLMLDVHKAELMILYKLKLDVNNIIKPV